LFSHRCLLCLLLLATGVNGVASACCMQINRLLINCTLPPDIDSQLNTAVELLQGLWGRKAYQ
jgi:hypothetical protein